jgi:hypothetical protein
MHGYYSKKVLRLDRGTGFYSAPVNLAKTPPHSLLLIVFRQPLLHCKK